MNAEAGLSVAVVAGCVALLISGRFAPDLVLAGGAVLLVGLGILSPAEALAGLANEGLATIALLYVVAAGIRETGGTELLLRRVLGRPRTVMGAQLRLMLPVVLASGFMNNTPLVATFIPAVQRWARKLRLSPSKLLLPLSYAAILGGTCTVIGTSTNLVVNGLLVETRGQGIGFFEIAWVGVPVALVGVGFILLVGGRWLPDRVAVEEAFGDPREYTVEMRVEVRGPLVGQTVEEAGLRGLADLYLVEIERDGRLIAAVGPHERLRGDDRLIFAGAPEAVMELQQHRGLRPCVEASFDPQARYPERCLVEVVISPQSVLLGSTLREGRFRTQYGASVIAVARHGQRISGKPGEVRLQAGDTLLLETRPSFLARHRYSASFLLVSPVSSDSLPRHERGWLAWSILFGVVLSASLGWLPMVKAAILGAAAMLLSGCCPVMEARRSIDTQVLLAVAASFALGRALESTGAAAVLADSLLQLAGGNPWWLLVAVYLATSLLTEAVTNNAVAVLMVSITLAATEAAGVQPVPYLIAIMMGASASFATPIGYQTNLMVYGVGGYRFSDYLRLGLPLNLVVGITAVLVIPWAWPLR